MDHMMMHLDQHHHSLEEQCCNQRDAAMAASTRSSASASVSQVAFVLAAVAFLTLFSSSFLSGAAAAAGASSSSLPSGAALYARLAALCGFVMTKKALFVLSNAIFLFLAADCRCFFSGVCCMATTPTSDDIVTASELPPCAVQARPCGSYSENLYYCYHQRCISELFGKRAEVPVSSRPEPAGLHGDKANVVTLETVVIVEEPTCGGEAEEELEKLEMDELNRKFEDFIQSRRIKWLKEEEEEEQVLQCQQQQL